MDVAKKEGKNLYSFKPKKKDVTLEELQVRVETLEQIITKMDPNFKPVINKNK